MQRQPRPVPTAEDVAHGAPVGVVHQHARGPHAGLAQQGEDAPGVALLVVHRGVHHHPQLQLPRQRELLEEGLLLLIAARVQARLAQGHHAPAPEVVGQARRAPRTGRGGGCSAGARRGPPRRGCPAAPGAAAGGRTRSSKCLRSALGVGSGRWWATTSARSTPKKRMDSRSWSLRASGWRCASKRWRSGARPRGVSCLSSPGVSPGPGRRPRCAGRSPGSAGSSRGRCRRPRRRPSVSLLADLVALGLQRRLRGGLQARSGPPTARPAGTGGAAGPAPTARVTSMPVVHARWR